MRRQAPPGSAVSWRHSPGFLEASFGMLHAKLKAATSPYHDRLDGGLARVLLGTTLTPVIYGSLLQRLRSFVSGWEDRAACVTAEALPGFVDGRRKAGLLRRDIRSMGQTIDERSIPIADLPTLDNVSAALGSMYVMEGSTLGGRVIAPRVRRQLALADNAGGTAYFESYGAVVGEQWREFLQTLEARVPTEGHQDAIDAACATFAAMERWLLGTKPDETGTAS